MVSTPSKAFYKSKVLVFQHRRKTKRGFVCVGSVIAKNNFRNAFPSFRSWFDIYFILSFNLLGKK